MTERMKEKLKKINNKWVRLFAWILVGINTGAMILGYEISPFDNEQIVNGVSLIALYGVEIWNHWKNNSYTEDAKHADRVLESKKRTKRVFK